MSYNYNDLVGQIVEHRRSIYHPPHDDKDDTSSSSFATTRNVHLLQRSLDAFQTLSRHCPMTPLLWMQYAYDTGKYMELLLLQQTAQQEQQAEDEPNITSTDMAATSASSSALETQSQMLEMGLQEFPGSAILHLYYVETLKVWLDCMEGSADTMMKIRQIYEEAIQEALRRVGQGSHRNESAIVVRFFHLYVTLLATKEDIPIKERSQNVLQAFIDRAKTPMNDDWNASLFQQVQEFANAHHLSFDSHDWMQLEHARKYESKYYSSLISYEDELDIAMQHDGVLYRNFVDILSSASIPWETNILNRSPPLSCWMGYGSHTTANAFIRYAQFCSRYRLPNHRNHLQQEQQQAQIEIHNLTIPIYERGVAECPTVETLWISYLRQLVYLIQKSSQDTNNNNNNHNSYSETLSKQSSSSTTIPSSPSSNHYQWLNQARSVVDRAVKNCPYSVLLAQYQLRIMGWQANAALIHFDPEELYQTIVVEQILGSKFMVQASQVVEIFVTLTQVIRRRILFLLQRLESTNTTTITIPTSKNDQTKDKKKSKQTKMTKPQTFDDPEPIATSPITIISNQILHPDTASELEDYCTDLQELYDQMDEYLCQHYPKTNKESRARLWTDRAFTETHLIVPLLHTLTIHREEQNDNHENASSFSLSSFSSLANRFTNDVVRAYDKATKVNLPVHPHVFVEYVQAVYTSFPLHSPHHVLMRLRQVRWLYQKALTVVGKKVKENNNQNRKNDCGDDTAAATTNVDVVMTQFPSPFDYEISLRCLCQNYLSFEIYFGSDHSYDQAYKAVQKKLIKAFGTVEAETTITTTTPVLHNDGDYNTTSQQGHIDTKVDGDNMPIDDMDEPAAKRQKTMNDDTTGAPTAAVVAVPLKPTNLSTKTMAATTTTSASSSSSITKQHKVKVGNLEYPAHPFTVRVSFLHLETQDMDLVDIFRPKCGPIVHAKIMRDKGKSKGWALVQFEEKESVETALALSDVIGIHGKSVKIERSHMPAVTLVPPGMHRVNPKGHGKGTKRNEIKKQKAKQTPSAAVVAEKEFAQQQEASSGNNNDKTDEFPPTEWSSTEPSNRPSSGATMTTETTLTSINTSSKKTGGKSAVLAFRPRGIGMKKKVTTTTLKTKI